MSKYNHITLEGNVTRDPELRFTATGRAVSKFGLAVNERYQQGGEWKEDTHFFDVVCWQALGENVAASVAKGDRVIVTGKLNQRRWETDNGDKRSTVEVVADAVGASLQFATVDITKVTREKAAAGASTNGGSGWAPPADWEDDGPI